MGEHYVNESKADLSRHLSASFGGIGPLHDSTAVSITAALGRSLLASDKERDHLRAVVNALREYRRCSDENSYRLFGSAHEHTGAKMKARRKLDEANQQSPTEEKEK